MKQALRLWFLALSLFTPSFAQSAPPGLERCLTLDETALRRELREVAREFFDAELGAVDLPRMVESKWLELGMPALLEAEVEEAVDSVQSETGSTRRFTSSFSPTQATELAEQVANRAFSSTEFRQRLETMASEVAADFINSFTSVGARSASSATECVQSYLGNTYGNAVSAAYGQQLQAQIEAAGAKALTGNFRPDNPVLRSGSAGVITIAGGYIARAVAQRLSAQITRRVAGNIATRVLGRAGSAVIPVVGWVVGGVLVISDIIDSAVRGPFPAIRRQLAGDETQRQIQQEITASLREDMPTVSAEISAGIANEIFTQWQAFAQNFNLVLKLSRRNAAFRQELGKVPEIDLYKLAEVVQTVPEADILEATRNGELRRVVDLPESSLEILETSLSITTVLAWADLAGTRLDDVADNEIYRYKTPDDFSQLTLKRLLATDNAATVARVATLPKKAMDTLLQQLPTANLNALADEFGTAQLEIVAWYANALGKEPFNALVVRFTERPSRLEKFEPDAIRTAVVNSREPETAVTFLGNEPTLGLFGLDLLWSMNRDLSAIFRGRVSSRLFLAKYDIGSLLLGGLVVLIAFFALIVFINRLTKLFGRRKHA